MQRKRSWNKWRLVIIILSIALVGLILSPTNFKKPVRNYFWVAMRPFGLAFNATFGKALPFIKDILQLRSVLKENSNLIAENSNLQSQLALLLETQNENEILKQELGFMANINPAESLPTAIIGQSNGYLKSVVIDKGQNAGLKNGQAVVSHGVLVGTISEVRQNNAEVILITDFSSLVPVLLQNSRGTGLLRGGLSGLTIENIPLNISIQKDENVVTSGLGGEIPSGILVGKATDVISKKGEIFQKVTVSSSIDFSSLKVIFVQKTHE